ncbi:unnamed protein product, partial [Prorocentrum cordatum]
GTGEQPLAEQPAEPPKENGDEQVEREKEYAPEEERAKKKPREPSPTRSGTSGTSGTGTETTATSTTVSTATSPLTTSIASSVEAVGPEASRATKKITTLGASTTTLAPTTTTEPATLTTSASTTRKTTVPTTTKSIKVVAEGPADEGDGSVQSGDVIFLKTHTGYYVDAQGGKVRARQKKQGEWQRMTITKEGGGTIWSEDTVFLRTNTGKNLNVD